MSRYAARSTIEVSNTSIPALSSWSRTFLSDRDATAALVRVSSTLCGIARRAMRSWLRMSLMVLAAPLVRDDS